MNQQRDLPADVSPRRAILDPELPPAPAGARAAITAGWVRNEADHVRALLGQARARQLTGVGLKDETDADAPPLLR